MGWCRDVLGGVLAGIGTVGLFGAAPLAALLSGLPELVSVIVTEDREAVFLPADDFDEEGFIEMVFEPPPSGADPETDQLASEGGSDRGASEAGSPIPEEAATGSERVARGGDPQREAHDPGKVRQNIQIKEPPKPTRKRRCEPDRIPEISKSGAGSWTIDRSLIRGYTRNLKAINALGWSRQHDGPDGRPDGMLIGGVQCNNDLYRAGVRSGDIVHTVNDHKVNNVPQALIVYGKVRRDRLIRVVITRRGQRKTLTYRLTG